ncbi:hypothetical protein RyT2_20320 [Pseudolactococcus yaeyamensis]
MNLKKSFGSLAVVSMLLAPQVLAASTAIPVSADSTAVVTQSVQGAPELKSAVTVNGNKLYKNQAIMPGDTVVWDIYTTPGNTGLMDYFEDELPVGIKFDPNSKYAMTVYTVKNDGTVGAEVTDQGKTTINGQKIKWVPKDPTKYFFVGSSTDSRLLFHITSKAEGTVDTDTILTNKGSLSVTNPKTPDKPKIIEDTAKVHTVKEIEPEIRKEVSADDGKTWSTKEQLAHKNDVYKYRLTVTVPVNTIQTKFTITDPMELVQTHGKVTILDNGKDVTKSFKITDENGQLVAHADANFVKILKKAKETHIVVMTIDDVSLEKANFKDLGKYEVGGIAYVPNVASADLDKSNIESNKTLVTPPNEPGKPAIGKSVSLDDGKTYVQDGTLGEKTTEYDYKLEASVPQASEQPYKSVVIKDKILAGQDLDLKEVHVYRTGGAIASDGSMKDVTTDKERKEVTANGALAFKDGILTWTPNVVELKYINDNNGETKYTVEINNVDLRKATEEQLKEYTDKDGKITVPNTGTLELTPEKGKVVTIDSKETTVTWSPKVENPDLPHTGNPEKPQNPIEQFLGNLPNTGETATTILAYFGGMLLLALGIFGAYKKGILSKIKNKLAK